MMIARQGLGLARTSLRSMAPISRMGLRSVSTIKVSHEQEQELLKNQRLRRPGSPHLTIYEPQITAILSSFHRLTGVAMGFAFYGITVAYAATSLLSIPFDSSILVSAFASLPVAAKVSLKALMAYPFVFHAFNGIRHLVWDFGYQLTVPGVYRTGYTVLAATAVFGTILAFFY